MLNGLSVPAKRTAALMAVSAGLALGTTMTAAPASAAGAATPELSGVVWLADEGVKPSAGTDLNPTCLDSDGTDITNGGPIYQWGCASGALGDSPSPDKFQEWSINYDGNGLYQLQNVGAGDYCLDADAADVGNGGQVVQWRCNGSDPYQQWYITDIGNGILSIKNSGASNASIARGGAPMCLDVDFWNQFQGGPIMQYACNTTDNFQLWYIYY